MTILARILAALGVREPVPQPVDIEPMLDDLARAYHDKRGINLDWRHSVVDLMDALGMDSGIDARRDLARELGYPGNIQSTGAMNVWLHREIMRRVAENGGKVPSELM